MGTLQPGLPYPATLPQFWTLIVIDLKDWVFLPYHFVNTIPPDLHLLCLPLSRVPTLNDLQKFLKTINWVRPLLGITTEQLYPLFQLLKGNPELTSPHTLTPRATVALEQITQILSARQALRKVDDIPVNFYLNFIENSYCSPIQITNACTMFIDGSGKTGWSVC